MTVEYEDDAEFFDAEFELDRLFQQNKRKPTFISRQDGKYVHHRCKGGKMLFIDWPVVLCSECGEVWNELDTQARE